jgi:hypothetical protein
MTMVNIQIADLETMSQMIDVSQLEQEKMGGGGDRITTNLATGTIIIEHDVIDAHYDIYYTGTTTNMSGPILFGYHDSHGNYQFSAERPPVARISFMVPY